MVQQLKKDLPTLWQKNQLATFRTGQSVLSYSLKPISDHTNTRTQTNYTRENTTSSDHIMREFILYSRSGRTDPNWASLHDAGRLDIVHECIQASLFLSHAIRKNTIFHAILNGPPKPPIHLTIDGSTLYDVRTDQQTWQQILKKTLSNKPHPGITKDKSGFETLVKTKTHANQPIYVLEEHGQNINGIALQSNSVFILGDHVGLPPKAEQFALRYGTKISLGKQPYLAATCITIMNYMLDVQAIP